MILTVCCVSQNKVALWVTVFCEIFREIQLSFLLTFDRSIRFYSTDFSHMWSKLFKKHAEKNSHYKVLIKSCFTNCSFSGQYLNCKIIFEFLRACYTQWYSENIQNYSIF